jgi:hypothetical protein
MSRLVVALVAPALLAGALPSQMVVTLTDGTTTRGALTGIAADGGFSWQGTGGPLKIPAERVAAVDSGAAIVPPGAGSFRIELATGDALVGSIEDGSADDVRVRNAGFGEITVALDDVIAIWNLEFPRAPESLPPVRGGAEMLYVDRDGRTDSLPGTLERIGKGQLVFSSDAGKDRAFSFGRDRVIAVKSAAVASRPPKGPVAVATMQDGSRLSGTLLPSDGARIGLRLSHGPEVSIDARRLKALAVANAALRYLSDLEPSGFTETPLFEGATPQGLHRDRGLRSGPPLRIGRQTFTKGILVPARSRVAYALDGQSTRFVATVGADASFPGGDLAGSVRATVLVDGKPAWTSGLMRAGQPGELVEVGGLHGARVLAIEVDFGDSFDAGARATFGNAMLIK